MSKAIRIRIPSRATQVIRQAQDAEQNARNAWQNYAQGVAAAQNVPEGFVLEWRGGDLYWVPPGKRSAPPPSEAPSVADDQPAIEEVARVDDLSDVSDAGGTMIEGV